MSEQEVFAELVAAGLTQAVVAKAYIFGASSIVSWWGVGFVLAAARKALGMV